MYGITVDQTTALESYPMYEVVPFPGVQEDGWFALVAGRLMAPSGVTINLIPFHVDKIGVSNNLEPQQRLKDVLKRIENMDIRHTYGMLPVLERFADSVEGIDGSAKKSTMQHTDVSSSGKSR